MTEFWLKKQRADLLEKTRFSFFFLAGGGAGRVTSPQNSWKGGSQVIAGKREVQYQAGGREDKERRKMLSVELLD